MECLRCPRCGSTAGLGCRCYINKDNEFVTHEGFTVKNNNYFPKWNKQNNNDFLKDDLFSEKIIFDNNNFLKDDLFSNKSIFGKKDLF